MEFGVQAFFFKLPSLTKYEIPEVLLLMYVPSGTKIDDYGNYSTADEKEAILKSGDLEFQNTDHSVKYFYVRHIALIEI